MSLMLIAAHKAALLHRGSRYDAQRPRFPCLFLYMALKKSVMQVGQHLHMLYEQTITHEVHIVIGNL